MLSPIKATGGSHKGDNTHFQDQSIASVAFSPINISVTKNKKLIIIKIMFLIISQLIQNQTSPHCLDKISKECLHC